MTELGLQYKHTPFLQFICETHLESINSSSTPFLFPLSSTLNPFLTHSTPSCHAVLLGHCCLTRSNLMCVWKHTNTNVHFSVNKTYDLYSSPLLSSEWLVVTVWTRSFPDCPNLEGLLAIFTTIFIHYNNLGSSTTMWTRVLLFSPILLPFSSLCLTISNRLSSTSPVSGGKVV